MVRLFSKAWLLQTRAESKTPTIKGGRFRKCSFLASNCVMVSTSPELLSDGNKAYAEKFIEIVRTVTKHAIEHEFSNYRTWWQFSKVVQNIPPTLIQYEDVTLFDYWLNDPYERDLVAEEIGEKWLPALLESDDEHCKALACKLLDMMYRPEYRKIEGGSETRKEAALRFSSWHARKITKKIASLDFHGLLFT